jgi:hypothetical protein
MADDMQPVHLNNHHRDTLVSIFQHPVSHNIDWKAVISLLSVVGTVEEAHDGKFHVTVGDETEVFEKPRHKDVDTQLVVDLRRMLKKSGYAPLANQVTNEGKEV